MKIVKIRLDEGLFELVEKYCSDKNITKSQMITKALAFYMITELKYSLPVLKYARHYNKSKR